MGRSTAWQQNYGRYYDPLDVIFDSSIIGRNIEHPLRVTERPITLKSFTYIVEKLVHVLCSFRGRLHEEHPILLSILLPILQVIQIRQSLRKKME